MLGVKRTSRVVHFTQYGPPYFPVQQVLLMVLITATSGFSVKALPHERVRSFLKDPAHHSDTCMALSLPSILVGFT